MDMQDLVSFLPLVAAGLGVGFLIGLTGVGGGSVMTPLLISSFGIPPQAAVGTDLLFASITKFSACLRHHALENIDWRLVRRMAMGSLPASLCVVGWLIYARPEMAAVAGWIRFSLGLVLPLSAVAILLYPVLLDKRREEERDISRLRRVLTVLFGIFLGVMVTLTSVGAGAIGVAVLAALYPALPARRVVGTDIAHAIPLTFVSGLGHAGLGQVQFGLLLALLVGSIPGMWVGTSLAGRAPDWLLRPVLAITLFYASYTLLSR